MSKHIANVYISPELLRDILHFPEDTNILCITMDNEYLGSIKITIENQELPLIEEGERIPEARPIYHRYHGDNGEIIRVERQDWGIR